ncbi:hypothetical protein [Bacillus sp. mrc49]|uniref:hypothetical protein n=1 Tax=Bacillus sp. mrc49 TaxID=2054913 RepID=UPI000C27A037|nr:hypothetical protein [Bacillus sp. mrc49]PJN86673.1 hypothetical protein CVN76_26780 [Bacillus sp. mrc49]
MRGIVLLNPNYSIGELHMKDSFTIQQIVTNKYMEENNISPVILNPYQLNLHYTIPHELLYNLQNKKIDQIDCLIMHSMETLERFIYIYPEKWLALSGYFKEIIPVTTQTPGKKYEAN